MSEDQRLTLEQIETRQYAAHKKLERITLNLQAPAQQFFDELEELLRAKGRFTTSEYDHNRTNEEKARMVLDEQLANFVEKYIPTDHLPSKKELIDQRNEAIKERDRIVKEYKEFTDSIHNLMKERGYK